MEWFRQKFIPWRDRLDARDLARHMTKLERPDADTVVQYGPLVAKTINVRPVVTESEPKTLHGNDARVKNRQAETTLALMAARSA